MISNINVGFEKHKYILKSKIVIYCYFNNLNCFTWCLDTLLMVKTLSVKYQCLIKSVD